MTRNRGLRSLRAASLVTTIASTALLLSGIGPSGAAAEAPTTEVRAEWISSVSNIDWPSEPGLSAQEQKAEYTAMLDQAVAHKLNTVFVQVRPTADAFWPSPHEPWSHWLTGEQGADPGYDPLAFMVAEAHERGLEFHAWFNPYRVSMQADPNQLVPEHPAREHPEWVFAYDGKLYYDPGVPEARAFVEKAILDAVENYDVDGVHLDDYFYPYPAEGEELPDADTFAEHGGDFTDIEDWRRNNVDLLVSELDEKIHAAKPDVKFGVSPFGIWRNASSDTNGSDTSGLESYSAIYADSRKWVQEGWVDYINPQVYWPIGHAAADYATLVPWWAETVDGTGVELYIGQGAHRVGDEGWEEVGELSDHLTLNQGYPQVTGDVYFSASSLSSNAEEAFTQVIAEHYADYRGGGPLTGAVAVRGAATAARHVLAR